MSAWRLSLSSSSSLEVLHLFKTRKPQFVLLLDAETKTDSMKSITMVSWTMESIISLCIHLATDNLNHPAATMVDQ